MGANVWIEVCDEGAVVTDDVDTGYIVVHLDRRVCFHPDLEVCRLN